MAHDDRSGPDRIGRDPSQEGATPALTGPHRLSTRRRRGMLGKVPPDRLRRVGKKAEC
jgi:hypothetical protein